MQPRREVAANIQIPHVRVPVMIAEPMKPIVFAIDEQAVAHVAAQQPECVAIRQPIPERFQFQRRCPFPCPPQYVHHLSIRAHDDVLTIALQPLKDIANGRLEEFRARSVANHERTERLFRIPPHPIPPLDEVVDVDSKVQQP